MFWPVIISHIPCLVSHRQAVVKVQSARLRLAAKPVLGTARSSYGVSVRTQEGGARSLVSVQSVLDSRIEQFRTTASDMMVEVVITVCKEEVRALATL